MIRDLWTKQDFLQQVKPECKAMVDTFIKNLEKKMIIQWSDKTGRSDAGFVAKYESNDMKYSLIEYGATSDIMIKIHEIIKKPPFNGDKSLLDLHFQPLANRKVKRRQDVKIIVDNSFNLEKIEQIMTEIDWFISVLQDHSLYTAQTPSKALNIDSNISMESRQMSEAENLIYYGPPGTGKTYKLQRYFEEFTSGEGDESREIFLQRVVSDKSWFQVVAAALLDLGGKAKVPDLIKHELVVARFNVSTSKVKSTTLWATLQVHTEKECPDVSYTPDKRYDPLVFWKDANSNWSINKDKLESEAPDVFTLVSEANAQPDKSEVKRYEFITFHQSYSYEEFIEGIRPVINDSSDEDNGIAYRIEDGIFKKISERARRDPNNHYALFIDEINRGNISKIFGELITLVELDKRIGAKNELRLTLPYSKQEFGVAENLSIIGTMNTADRSIALVDIALRRRFEFIEMMPQSNLIPKNVEGVNARDLLETINRRIEYLYDRDHVIGHADFMAVSTLDDLRKKFCKKVIPLLQEYFYGDWRKICLVLGCPCDDYGVQQNSPMAIIQATSLGLGYETDQFEGNAVSFAVNPNFLNAPGAELEAFFSRILKGR